MVNCYIVVTDRVAGNILRDRKITADNVGTDTLTVSFALPNNEQCAALETGTPGKSGESYILELAIPETLLTPGDRKQMSLASNEIPVTSVVHVVPVLRGVSPGVYGVVHKEIDGKAFFSPDEMYIPATACTTCIAWHTMPVKTAIGLIGTLMDAVLDHSSVGEADSTHMKAPAFVGGFRADVDMGKYLDMAAASEIFQVLRNGPYSKDSFEVVLKLANTDLACASLLLHQMVLARTAIPGQPIPEVQIGWSPGEVEDYLERKHPEKLASVRRLIELEKQKRS